MPRSSCSDGIVLPIPAYYNTVYTLVVHALRRFCILIHIQIDLSVHCGYLALFPAHR